MITQAGVTNVAVLIILMHLLIILVIPTILAIAAWRGLVVLNRKMPVVMPQVQGYARQLAEITEKTSEQVKEPLIKADAAVVNQQARVDRATAPLRRWLDKTFPLTVSKEDVDGREF